MNRKEALIYWVRYSIAEAIFKIAAWVKPTNYEFDAVRDAMRDAIHMMIMYHGDDVGTAQVSGGDNG